PAPAAGPQDRLRSLVAGRPDGRDPVGRRSPPVDLDHHHLRANEITVHYVRHGSGFPLVLLHGWPEFWRVWRKVIEPLGRRYDVIAPDLRGFGASDKPGVAAQDGYRLEDHVGDLLGPADALGLGRLGIVSHDVRAHGAHNPGAFDDEDVAAWVDNFLEPGNLQGGFNWYIAANSARLDLIRHGPPKLEPIKVPVRVRWGASDKVLKVEWADQLGEYFSDCDFAPVEDAGHFVAYERPEFAVREISEFFSALA